MVGVKSKSGIYERKPFTKKHKENMSKSMKGKNQGPKTKECRKNISKSLIGRTLSENHKNNISKANVGENNGNWLGGKSIESYSVDWTKTLKRAIRERDNYICQLCGKQQGDRAYSIHHIDYDKTNCNPNNLITLCNSCHGKTNYNRKKWEIYFKNGSNICS